MQTYIDTYKSGEISEQESEVKRKVYRTMWPQSPHHLEEHTPDSGVQMILQLSKIKIHSPVMDPMRH